LAKDSVSGQLSVDDLGDDFRVGDSGNQSVFWGDEFVHVLSDHSFSGMVVGFSFSSSSEFCLESFKVCFVFDDFDEHHL
jgi:hypothetical protein